MNQPPTTLFALADSGIYGSGSRLFLVTGRVPESDDDSAYLIRGESKADATETFRDIESDNLSEDEKAYHQQKHGDVVYVTSCTELGRAMGSLPPTEKPPVLLVTTDLVGNGSGSDAWLMSGNFHDDSELISYLVRADGQDKAESLFVEKAIQEHGHREDIDYNERVFGSPMHVNVAEHIGTVICEPAEPSAG